MVFLNRAGEITCYEHDLKETSGTTNQTNNFIINKSPDANYLVKKMEISCLQGCYLYGPCNKQTIGEQREGGKVCVVHYFNRTSPPVPAWPDELKTQVRAAVW